MEAGRARKSAVQESLKEIEVKVKDLEPKNLASMAEPAKQKKTKTHVKVRQGRNWSILREECGAAGLALLPRFEGQPISLANYRVERIPEPWLRAFLKDAAVMCEGLRGLSKGLEHIFQVLVVPDTRPEVRFLFENRKDEEIMREGQYSPKLMEWCRVLGNVSSPSLSVTYVCLPTIGGPVIQRRRRDLGGRLSALEGCMALGE